MTLATGTGIRESTSGHPAGSSEFDSTFPEAPGPDQHPGLTPSSAPNDSPTHGNDPLCLGQEYPEGHCQDVVAAHNSLGRDELVPAHAISGALAHVSESSYCQDFQFRRKRGRVHSSLASHALKLPPEHRQPSRRIIIFR